MRIEIDRVRPRRPLWVGLADIELKPEGIEPSVLVGGATPEFVSVGGHDDEPLI
jgi:hypothetical protein